MKVRHEMVAVFLLNHHPLVGEKFQNIYRFIVTEFVPCTGITILQCFTHLLITANISIGKC